MKKYFSLAILILFLSGCGNVRVPEGIEPVQAFEVQRYLGKWYEIARLDHSFERGMDRVTADYALRDDGGIDVINRGFDNEDQEFSEAHGRAYFVASSQTGYLKVSFFRPFYGAYVIFALDEKDYSYALVSGPERKYLWILSRTPKLDARIQKSLIEKAKNAGFDTEKLIFVKHDRNK